jgi:hypothetical protein
MEMDESKATLTIGSRAATRIEFESRTGEASVAQAADLARLNRTVWTYGERPDEWIVGRGELGVLRVVRGERSGDVLIDELREIERCVEGDDRDLAAIFGAIVSAERACAEGSTHVEGPPAFFAQLAEAREPPRKSAWNDEELEETIKGCLSDMGNGRGLRRPAAGPVDSVRFWLGMGERLWDRDVRKRLSKSHLGATTRKILMMLAGSWMELRPEGSVVVRGAHFRLRGAARRMAWPQVMEWEAGEINHRTLKYLTAYVTTFSFDGILMGVLGLEPWEGEAISPIVAARESRSLLEEAALGWVCDPFGSFRVDLPGRTPLTRWGVTSLRVWIVRGQGLWIALEKDEQPGPSLEWRVRPPYLRRWVVDEMAIPGIHLTLSALWRDLKIGGREAMLLKEGGRHEVEQKGGKQLGLHGRIRWGSEDELGRILREAYPVEEHIRALPAGKRATRRAYKLAMSQGIVLRQGTTFVRRHQRGKPDETAANIPLKAQGLARLILASRPDHQRNGVPTR